jgi:UDP-N-acetylglucosamine 2-epimerase (non-hydrolysing)
MGLRRIGTEIIIHTGQHYDYDMDRIFFDELSIPAPDYHLGVGSGSHGAQTGEMLKGIETILMKERPDWVVVFGDTNTTLAGALAAVKLQIPIAHVEAGLRSFDRTMPEEINRILTDHISDLLFCPSQAAVDHLRREGVERGVHVTGDVMVDILVRCSRIARETSTVLDDLDLTGTPYFLATVHRAENTDNPERLKGIVEAFTAIETPIVFPCHPRTEKLLKAAGLYDRLARSVRIVAPVGYLDMLLLEQHARKILTDSGGVQKEAYLLQVPCITLRESTEWRETLEDGWNVLVGSRTETIVEAAKSFAPSPSTYTHRFGSGGAGRAIARLLESGKPSRA